MTKLSLDAFEQASEEELMSVSGGSGNSSGWGYEYGQKVWVGFDKTVGGGGQAWGMSPAVTYTNNGDGTFSKSTGYLGTNVQKYDWAYGEPANLFIKYGCNPNERACYNNNGLQEFTGSDGDYFAAVQKANAAIKVFNSTVAPLRRALDW